MGKKIITVNYSLLLVFPFPEEHGALAFFISAESDVFDGETGLLTMHVQTELGMHVPNRTTELCMHACA